MLRTNVPQTGVRVRLHFSTFGLLATVGWEVGLIKVQLILHCKLKQKIMWLKRHILLALQIHPKGSRVEGKQVAGEGSKFTSWLTHRWARLNQTAQRTRQSEGPIYHTRVSAGPGGPF